MPEMSYPLRHVSVRVPWHDNHWDGSVCKEPKYNTACLKLKSIAENKDETAEEAVKGYSLNQLIAQDHELPPCVNGRGTFMADFDFVRHRVHPYAKNNLKTHGHYQPTPLRHPAYAAAALPFRWMLRSAVMGDEKNDLPGLVERFPLEEFDERYEPDLGFETIWLQDYRNHQAVLNCFWKHVRPQDSLVFFYAKQVPLVEDVGRRVLIGVGRVKTLGGLTEYDSEGDPDGKLRSLLWEKMLVQPLVADMWMWDVVRPCRPVGLQGVEASQPVPAHREIWLDDGKQSNRSLSGSGRHPGGRSG